LEHLPLKLQEKALTSGRRNAGARERCDELIGNGKSACWWLF
jgi:hypothetical protein